MEGTVRDKTLRESARRAEGLIQRAGRRDASQWTEQRAYDLLRQRCIALGFPRAVRSHVVVDRSKEWSDALELMLAMCESDDVDPTVFIESIAATMGWWSMKNRVTIRPQHCRGTGAVERYHRWLKREQKHQGRVVLTQRRDRRLEAESAFVEVYGMLKGLPAADRRGAARAAAIRVFSEYEPDRRRRVIALCGYLHRRHHDLPDVIVLRPRWRMRDVFKTADVLLEP